MRWGGGRYLTIDEYYAKHKWWAWYPVQAVYSEDSLRYRWIWWEWVWRTRLGSVLGGGPYNRYTLIEEEGHE